MVYGGILVKGEGYTNRLYGNVAPQNTCKTVTVAVPRGLEVLVAVDFLA